MKEEDEAMVRQYIAGAGTRMPRSEYYWIVPYFGGIDGAFRENVHEMVINLEAVASRSVTVGQSLEFLDLDPKEELKEMKHKVDTLLKSVLDFKDEVAALTALINIKKEED